MRHIKSQTLYHCTTIIKVLGKKTLLLSVRIFCFDSFVWWWLSQNATEICLYTVWSLFSTKHINRLFRHRKTLYSPIVSYLSIIYICITWKRTKLFKGNCKKEISFTTIAVDMDETLHVFITLAVVLFFYPPYSYQWKLITQTGSGLGGYKQTYRWALDECHLLGFWLTPRWYQSVAFLWMNGRTIRGLLWQSWVGLPVTMAFGC